MINEIWKDIDGYEGLYQISNLGRVKSYDRVVMKRGFPCTLNSRVLKNSNNGNGYLTYSLNIGNKNTKTFYAHRLVAIHFLKQVPGKDYINHKDGNKNNNTIENLEWCTCAENQTHSFNTGLHSRVGANHSLSKIVLNTLTGIFYETLTEAANVHGIKKTTLCAMLTGKNNNRTPLIYA